MQFGVFSVGDVTTDPTTGRTPSEGERIEGITFFLDTERFFPLFGLPLEGPPER